MSSKRTPHQEFWLPILASLVRRGGSASTSELYEDVERTVPLTDYDRSETKRPPIEPLWRNQTRQAANRMRMRGLILPRIRNDWRQISEPGRQYLVDHRSATEPAPVDRAPQADDDEFVEGEERLRLHRRKERSRRAVVRKRAVVLATDGALWCEACGFDFRVVYGPLGAEFVECHHRVPLSQLTEAQRLRLSDLAVVCANCHRMLHRWPFHTVESLRALICRVREGNP